jgi:predicted nucleotidyltransferase
MIKTKSIYKNCYESIKSLILDIFKDEEVSIILFGSRAKGNFYNTSDIDIAILPKNAYDKRKLTLTREKIEKLNIPYKVEIVDLSDVSDNFKKNVLESGEIWKK